MCVYIYMCIYIYIYTYIHTHTYIYIYTLFYMYVFVYVSTHVCVDIGPFGTLINLHPRERKGSESRKKEQGDVNWNELGSGVRWCKCIFPHRSNPWLGLLRPSHHMPCKTFRDAVPCCARSKYRHLPHSRLNYVSDGKDSRRGPGSLFEGPLVSLSRPSVLVQWWCMEV